MNITLRTPTPTPTHFFEEEPLSSPESGDDKVAGGKKKGCGCGAGAGRKIET